jgi:hypothetical protein
MISTKSISVNAHPSIRDNLDPDSNVTEESDLHCMNSLSLSAFIEAPMAHTKVDPRVEKSLNSLSELIQFGSQTGADQIELNSTLHYKIILSIDLESLTEVSRADLEIRCAPLNAELFDELSREPFLE